jgi:hypothetical protein
MRLENPDIAVRLREAAQQPVLLFIKSWNGRPLMKRWRKVIDDAMPHGVLGRRPTRQAGNEYR